MDVRGAAAVGLVMLAGAALPGVSSAQSEFPLTGRWTYFDYGTRAVGVGELNDLCMSTWDSYSPDGGFIGFEMDDGGRVSAAYSGFCVVFGSDITCRYLLDSEVGAVDDPEEGQLSFYSNDVVDYILHDLSGKPDYASSWTYMRCPATAGFSVG